MKNERPPDESWWERELHRNEKLMDQYLALLAENPDLSRFERPEDLYNKLHYDIDPPDQPANPFASAKEITEDLDQILGFNAVTDALLSGIADQADQPDDARQGAVQDRGIEHDPPENEGYPEIARLARSFALPFFALATREEMPDILRLSAGKIGSNLAGGHGLGYGDQTLCGNIVKCRWALADCEFCCELLDELWRKTGRPEYRQLYERGVDLAADIRQRITRLRARVWW